ncbi:29336_t:CDS:1, partial [Racocetra persica]
INFDNVATIEGSIAYCKKTYNKCKIHNRQLVEDSNDPRIKIKGNTIVDKKTQSIVKVCKCSYDNLIEFCIWCNAECCSKRTLARYDDKSGPFDYILDEEIKSTNRQGANQYIKPETIRKAAIDTMNDILNPQFSFEEAIIKNAENNPHWIETNLLNAKIIYEAKEKINNITISFARCWKSCNIFIYGSPGTGKSYLLDILFPDAYKKPVNDPKWWHKYKEHDEVIINELSGSTFQYQELLNLLDRFEYNVQIKGSHINYSPFIQCFTSNIPLEELYRYAETEPRIRNNESWVPNRKYYNALERRFDYIIEYQR